MNNEIKKNRLFVSLFSEIDYGRLDQISTNAKINEMYNDKNLVYYEVENLKDASSMCCKYIKYFNLGSSNWSGGRVVNENFEFIARISYNGRIWDNMDYFKSKEIIC